MTQNRQGDDVDKPCQGPPTRTLCVLVPTLNDHIYHPPWLIDLRSNPRSLIKGLTLTTLSR